MSLTPAEAENFWKTADKNNDGSLTMDELQKAIKLYSPNIKDCKIAGIFVGLDRDDDKKVIKREFLDELVNKQKRSDHFGKMWKKYDKDGCGQLSRGEVMEIIRDFFPPDQKNVVLGKFLSYCDLDNSGQISEDEFMAFFC